MKYLYIFKKKNGEIHITTEETAYCLIYETDERNMQEFLGRIHENEHRKLQPDYIRANREYREALSTGNTALARAIEDSNISGLMSEIEGDYYAKITAFGKQTESEMMQKLVAIAEMVKPNENSNITVPYGDRNSTIGLLRQMGI